MPLQWKLTALVVDTVRYAHPNTDLIGPHFTGGDEGPALQGEE